MTANSGPGWHQHPEHHVDLIPENQQGRALFAGQVIAESDRLVLVNETGHAPVVYFPRDSVHMELLRRSDQHSHCPFKGEASYFSISNGGGMAENAAWSYEHPYDEVMQLKDYIAFYPDKVAVEIGRG